MSTIQKPGYGAYAAAPGRNSTFFNNPYMGQIANNLSSAIYGNPRDELVREQIANAQANRARQAKQDDIAAVEKAREQDQLSQFGGSIAAALLLPEDERMPHIADAIRYGSENGMSLNDMSALLPYTMNQNWQGKSALSAQEAGQGLIHQAAGAEDDIALATLKGGIDLGNKLEIIDTNNNNTLTRDDILHENNVTLANLGYDFEDRNREDTQKFTTSERIAGQEYDTAESYLDRQENILANLIGESLWSDVLAGEALDTPDAEIKVLPNSEADPDGPQYKVGKDGESLIQIPPKILEEGRFIVEDVLEGMYPGHASFMDQGLKNDVLVRASEYYQKSGNWGTAVKKAAKELTQWSRVLNEGAKGGESSRVRVPIPRNASAPEGTVITPNSLSEALAPTTGAEAAPAPATPTRLRFDKNGNIIP